VDAVGPMPYTELQKIIDNAHPYGINGHFEASFLDELPRPTLS
jgi:hypothetical protein